MELDSKEPLLKKIRIDQLEPALQKEIYDFATLMGKENTITSSSNLNFLYKIYQSERLKEKRDLKRLKKAEKLILKLAGLRHRIVQRSGEPKEEEEGKRISGIYGRIETPVSKRMIDLFETIGIKDVSIMAQAIELMGEINAEERIELIHSTNLGEILLKKLFGLKPEMFLDPMDDDFIANLEILERKKDIVDNWAKARGKPEPPYVKNPEILFEDFHEITRVLELSPVEVAAPVPAKLEEIKYRGKPMVPEDFMKVIMAMGFSPVRDAKHGTVLSNPAGRIIGVQKAHKKQEMLNTSTIKKKLVEAGVNLNSFEKQRRELGL